MNGKSNHAALYQAQGAETAEEIIGVLTAISVVSKRMAKKLAMLHPTNASICGDPGLEQRTAEKEGVRQSAKTAAVSADAD